MLDESNVDNTCLEVDNTPTFTDVEVQTSNTYTTEVKLRRRIKSLHEKLRRKTNKINNMADLIKKLKNKRHIDLEQQNVILNNFNGKLYLSNKVNNPFCD